VTARTRGRRPFLGGVRAPSPYRGSWKRLRRVTLRGNWSTEVLVLVIFGAAMILGVIPWLVRNSLHRGHHGAPVSEPHLRRP
jgi:hypothetical protein